MTFQEIEAFDHLCQASRRIRRCWLLSLRAHQRRRRCRTGISVCACKDAMQSPGQRSWYVQGLVDQFVPSEISQVHSLKKSQEIWLVFPVYLFHEFTTNFRPLSRTVVNLQLDLSIGDACPNNSNMLELSGWSLTKSPHWRCGPLWKMLSPWHSPRNVYYFSFIQIASTNYSILS